MRIVYWLVGASALVACAQPTPGGGDGETVRSSTDALVRPSEAAIAEGRQLLRHGRAARLGGLVAVTRASFDEFGPPVSFVDIEFVDGPTERQLRCTRTVDEGCELQVCEPGTGSVEPVTVGPVEFSGAGFSTVISPDSSTTYPASLLLIDPATQELASLWNRSGDVVTTSYGGVSVRQLAPATGIKLEVSLPGEVARDRSYEVTWSGNQPGDYGMVTTHIVLMDNPIPTSNGVFPRVSLACSGPPASRRLRFPARSLSSLPAGNYFSVTQAESIATKADRVSHELVSTVADGFEALVVR